MFADTFGQTGSSAGTGDPNAAKYMYRKVASEHAKSSAANTANASAPGVMVVDVKPEATPIRRFGRLAVMRPGLL
jgi:hypothetical protein